MCALTASRTEPANRNAHTRERAAITSEWSQTLGPRVFGAKRAEGLAAAPTDLETYS